MKTLTAALLLLAVFSIPALAFYFPVPQPFHLGIYAKNEHPDVVMTDEFVSIVLGAEGAVVNSEFTFHNEGTAQTVPMYFLLESDNRYNMIDEDEYGGEPKVTTIEDISNADYNFFATVSGKEYPVQVSIESTIVYTSEESEPGYYYTQEYSHSYALYEIPFEAGETLTLSVKYWQRYSGPNFADWWHMYYKIHTGGSWKGPIGHGIVEVTAGSDFNWNGVWQYQSVSLPPATEKGGKLVWEFDELEPERDSIWGTCIRVMMPFDNQPCWGIVLVESGINFRSERNNTSARVAAHPVMKEGEYFTIFERQGDWWRVEDEEGNPGWLRWRYVDGDKENIYAAITPAKNTYHALNGGG
ncbi:SH3 domain-containing protein [bacterium]|nr:SH3 domain-containing protein [bacterium]